MGYLKKWGKYGSSNLVANVSEYWSVNSISTAQLFIRNNGRFGKLVFGDTADFKLPVAVAIIAIAIYGLLVPISGLQNWKILIGDMPESMASTASGAAAKKAPIGMYIIVTAVLTIAAAAAQLSALY